MADGAQNALAGYLYQFVGAAGLAARAKNPTAAHPRRSRSLFARLPGSTVVHELADMDAAVLLPGGADAVGVQYKYSPDTPPRPIDKQEVIDILDAFHRSTERADGIHFVEYVLISNRPLQKAAVSLYRTRSRTTPDPSLYPRTGRLGRLSKKAKKALECYGDELRAAAARHEILGKFTLHRITDREDCVRDIRDYASLHGILPPDFDQALSSLTGRILHHTSGSPLDLSVEFLNRSLIGVPDARALGPSASAGGAREAARSHCRGYIARTLTDDDSTLIRRRFYEDLDREVGQYPLVFIIGEGGSGKSVLAAQYLQHAARDRYVAAIAASDVDGNWPGNEFNRWRSPGYYGELPIEPIDGILGRIRQADREAPRPILLLNLDGIDEVDVQHRHAAKRLIGEFFRRGRVGTADAVLLVTCRSEGSDIDRAFRRMINRWFSTEVSFVYDQYIGRVVVEDFDREELLAAAGALGGAYRERLATSLHDMPADSDTGLIFVGDEGSAAASLSAIRREFARSFLHPAMWQAFVGIGEERRNRALDEEPAALRLLADSFLERFCRKAELRRPALSGDRILNTLRTIGAALEADASVFDRHHDWVVAARGPVGDEEASQLFEEAKSYGLIIETDLGRWSWRHGFVYDSLRGL